MAGNSTESGRSVTSKITSILMTFTEGSEHSPHRDRPAGRPAHLHRPPAHLRARLVAAAGAHATDGHYRAGLPLRMIGAGADRAPSIAERAPCVLEDLAAATRCRARLGVLQELEVAYIEKQPGPRPGHVVQPGRHAARPPDGAGPRAAGLLPARRRRHDDHARAAAVHPAHRDLPRPVPPGPRGHPADPRRGHPLGARGGRLRRGDAGVRARRRRRRPRIELAVRDLGRELQPMLAALADRLPQPLPRARRTEPPAHPGARTPRLEHARPPRWMVVRPAQREVPLRCARTSPRPVAEHRVRRRCPSAAGRPSSPGVLGRPARPSPPTRSPAVRSRGRPPLRRRSPAASLVVGRCTRPSGPGGLTMPAMWPPLPSTNRTGPLTRPTRLVGRLPRHDVVVDRADDVGRRLDHAQVDACARRSPACPPASLFCDVEVAQVERVHRGRHPGAVGVPGQDVERRRLLAHQPVGHHVVEDQVVGPQDVERARPSTRPRACPRLAHLALQLLHGLLVGERAQRARARRSRASC